MVILYLITLYFLCVAWPGSNSTLAKMAKTSWVYELSKVELEDELRLRDLDTSGTFAQLRSRLATFISQQAEMGMLSQRLIQRLPRRDKTKFQLPDTLNKDEGFVKPGAVESLGGSNAVGTGRETNISPSDVAAGYALEASNVVPAQGRQTLVFPNDVVPAPQHALPVLQNDNQMKLNRSVVVDLITSLPIITGTDPEELCQYLIKATSIFDLQLVPLNAYVMMLVSRTSGQVSHDFISVVQVSDSWESFCKGILEASCPHLIREELTMRYITRRFQSVSETFDSFINDIFHAARVLDYGGSEKELVDICLRNMLTSNKVHLTFVTKPTSRADLKNIAGELRHAIFIQQVAGQINPSPSSPSLEMNRNENNRPTRMSNPINTRPLRCWVCGVWGHRKDQCPTKSSAGCRVPPPLGNDFRVRK